MLGTAVHGVWCEARTWPTKCLTCRDDVFFFSCSHGCKVFFDELGWPWPVHGCDTSWARSLERLTNDRGDCIVEVAHNVDAIRSGDLDLDDLPDLYGSRSEDAAVPIVRMDPPPGAATTVLGVVREVCVEVDPYGRLGIPRTTVGTAALGPIGSQPVGRVTVHAPSPEEDDLLESFTAWMPSDALSLIRCGITVEADLEAVEVLGADVEWYCSSIRLLR